jgi:hypothetical protein
MKTLYLIGIVVIIIFTMDFVAAGISGSQSQVAPRNFIIDKAFSTKTNQHSLNSKDQFESDRSIFSKTNIISLIAAVIGIVAFRRNTYS